MPAIFKGNQIDLKEDHAVIFSSTNNIPILVDLDDVDRLRTITWRVSLTQKNGYNVGGRLRVGAHGKRENVLLSRYLIDAPDTHEVDHIDGDELNNRKYNLRLASRSQNAANRGVQCNSVTGYKGASPCSNGSGYMARIHKNGKTIYLGYFNDPIEAAKAYDRAAIKHFGEFAQLNFPEDNVNAPLSEKKAA